MARAGFELRHQTQGVNVPMYQTSMACRAAGAIAGPMVVSMRPVQANRVPEVCEITARYPSVHGSPVHAGDPATIGIRDINQPDWGEPVEIRPGEVPVFRGCGVTPQAVAQASHPTLMITHGPSGYPGPTWSPGRSEGSATYKGRRLRACFISQSNLRIHGLTGSPRTVLNL